METLIKYFRDFSKIDRIVFKTCILIFIVFLFSSCMATKKTHSDSTTTTEKVDKTKDSSKITETSKAIKDNIVINVPQNDNEEVMEMFNQMMRQLNTSKTSGDNSYKLYYDEKLQQLRAEFEVGETQSTDSSTNSDTISEKSFDSEVNDYIKKIVIPWWAYIIAFVFVWPYIKPIIMMFLGPTSIVSNIGTIIKPKK